MKKSVAVLGLGNYGKSLAEKLYDMGADVLVVDKDENLIKEFSSKCSAAICADLCNEEAVAALGLKNMDVVITSVAKNLTASIIAVAVAKEQGVPLIIAKSSSDRMSSILLRVGANKVIDPEEEGGIRSARILMSSSFKDFFELDDNMYVVEMAPKKDWIGKSLLELGLRKTLSINVIAIKKKGGLWQFVDSKTKFEEENSLLVVMEKKDVQKLN
ncbi:MAG: TrkA family potassium uptake protein [Eubacterium sp.]|nr:TrkA family potassium uptake protein [Eubacterium sp.]